ncbi:MAG TPA: efflux RND transporter periplasmic adaptor subunit, partial [Chitinophagaceae bacterium]
KKLISLSVSLLVTATVFTVTSCSENKAQTSNTEDAVIVRTQPVAVTDYAPALEYSGTIASESEAKLSFKIGGIISRIYVKEGDHVSKGQLLATLDLTEINAQVAQAKQNVEKANRDFTRVKNLFEDTAATLEQYQNVQTQHHVANESLRIAQFNQQHAQIRATDDGAVIKKIMNEGELASSGAPVIIMNGTSNEDWVVQFGVSDKDWAILKKGNVATVEIDAYPGTTFKGIVNKIAGAADPVSGTYEIEVKVLPNGKKFAAGLFATIKLNSSAPQKLSVIPIEALTEADGKTGYVYLLNPDKISVTKKSVQIAFIDKDNVVVRSGLENVSNVITDGLSYLTENSKVKLVN